VGGLEANGIQGSQLHLEGNRVASRAAQDSQEKCKKGEHGSLSLVLRGRGGRADESFGKCWERDLMHKMLERETKTTTGIISSHEMSCSKIVKERLRVRFQISRNARRRIHLLHLMKKERRSIPENISKSEVSFLKPGGWGGKIPNATRNWRNGLQQWVPGEGGPKGKKTPLK